MSSILVGRRLSFTARLSLKGSATVKAEQQSAVSQSNN
jgi:hypothetical protein